MEFYAWVTRLADGQPSFVGVYLRNFNVHLPLASHKRADIENAAVRAIAQQHALTTGQRVLLARFSQAEIIEIIPEAPLPTQ